MISRTMAAAVALTFVMAACSGSSPESDADAGSDAPVAAADDLPPLMTADALGGSMTAVARTEPSAPTTMALPPRFRAPKACAMIACCSNLARPGKPVAVLEDAFRPI